jgi:hypothetical protein
MNNKPKTKKEPNPMKSLTGLLQRSYSSWGAKLASVALIITVALFSLAAGSGDDNNQERGKHNAPQIEGSWLVTVTIPDGPPPFRAIETYSAGGGLLSTDGGTPPSAGHVYQGTWARTGRGEFAFTFLGLQYDAAGVHSGFIRVGATRTLERDANAYNGTDTVEFLDVNLNVVAGPFPGTTHGTRINAE